MISKSSFIGEYIENIEKFYNFEKELGSGAYGKVFRVQHLATKEYFACKKMNKRQINNKSRFKIEIDLLKATDHPYIVKLHEIYEDNIYLYLIMEECKGGELFDRLASRAKGGHLYTERESCEIFKKLVTGINYCHSHGVCHRDIKPENILFTDSDDISTLKIADFGLSRVFSNENKTMSSIVGTTFYMAPEVLRGNYNEKCDIWSAGCILYIMLCGRPPFYAKNDEELIRKIKSKVYSFNYPEFKNISHEAKDLITKMLCDQDKRLTAQGILDHTWVLANAPHSKEKILNVNFNNIVDYVNMDKIKKGVFSFISSRLSDKESRDLIEAFNSFDKNGDGVLTLKEVSNGLKYLKDKNGNKNTARLLENIENKVENLFNEMDLDKNGLINYSEFIAAAIDHKSYLKKEMIYEAFKAFDKDHLGKITLKGLYEIVRPQSQDDNEYIKKLFDEFDLDKDGTIDHDEFLHALDKQKIFVC